MSQLTNGSPASGDVARPVVLVLGHNDSNNDHAAEHNNGANDQHGLTANLVDNQLEEGALARGFTRSVNRKSGDLPWQGW